MEPIFLKAMPILKKIEDAGFEAYFVGGAVRDHLLHREIADIDIATSATPDEIKNIFPKTIDVGIEHGTVVILFDGNTYEVTTFRAEAEYKDYRRPTEVSFIRSLKDDLERRDFTMNAIAMDKTGKIIDPFFGKQAIIDRVIKTVGQSKDRFNEDALRMMRAVRFASQLAFEIEPATYEGLRKLGYLLENIAVERILVEFEKLILGPNRVKGLSILIESGLYQFLPGFKNYKDELYKISQLKIFELSSEEMWILLAHCFHLNGKELDRFLRNWKLPIKKIKIIQKGVQLLKNRLEQEWTVLSLFEAKLELILVTEKLFNLLNDQHISTSLNRWKKAYQELSIKDRKELAVTGEDLMGWFQQEGGPWIKEKLFSIEKAVLFNEVVNDKESIRGWLLKCNQS